MQDWLSISLLNMMILLEFYMANHVTQMVDRNIFVVKIRVQDFILDMQYLYAFSFCPSGKNILVECSKSLPTDVMNK